MPRFFTIALLLFGVATLSFAQTAQTRVRDGHNLLEEASAESAVIPGVRIKPLSFRDVDGNVVHLKDVVERGPAVFVTLSTTCPLAKRYTSRLKQLSAEYAEHDVSIFAIFPNEDETHDGVLAYAEAAEYGFPSVRDVDAYVARHLGATMTPQAFLVDQDNVMRYRGAIDDNRYENRVKNRYLAAAIDDVVSGHNVRTPLAKALGCTIHRSEFAPAGDVTYSHHIARILQDNCQSCHRSGQVAPFTLTNYEEAYRWKIEIREYTTSRLMPPWKAARGVAHYKNDISLSEREIELIARWVDAGAPRGDKDEIPPSPKFNDEWAYGEPDLIVEMPEEYVVGPEGEDDYRHFVIPYEAGQHRFVEAVDVQPGNRNVVHHVLGYIDTSGKARELDAEADGPGYSRFGDVGFKPASVIGGWAPGNLPIRTPRGTGRWLPKKCDIVLQVHYYRTGIEERDRTKIGLYFSKAPNPVPTRVGVVINKDFVIPAGEDNFVVKAHHTIEEPSYMYAVTPHMHLIGETMEVKAYRPDGSVLEAVRIDDWDFNWQASYYFQELQHLPAGTRVELTATFDNSESNPNNPNPSPVDIGWGEKTTDEMCIAFLGLLHESEYDASTLSRRAPVVAATKLDHD